MFLMGGIIYLNFSLSSPNAPENLNNFSEYVILMRRRKESSVLEIFFSNEIFFSYFFLLSSISLEKSNSKHFCCHEIFWSKPFFSPKNHFSTIQWPFRIFPVAILNFFHGIFIYSQNCGNKMVFVFFIWAFFLP